MDKMTWNDAHRLILYGAAFIVLAVAFWKILANEPDGYFFLIYGMLFAMWGDIKGEHK